MTLGDLEKIALSALTPDIIDQVEGATEEALGFTVARAAAFINESNQENPGQSMDDAVADATGKFKHYLRKSDKWESLVDVPGVWSNLEPLAAKLVNVAVSASQAPGPVPVTTSA